MSTLEQLGVKNNGFLILNDAGAGNLSYSDRNRFALVWKEDPRNIRFSAIVYAGTQERITGVDSYHEKDFTKNEDLFAAVIEKDLRVIAQTAEMARSAITGMDNFMHRSLNAELPNE